MSARPPARPPARLSVCMLHVLVSERVSVCWAVGWDVCAPQMFIESGFTEEQMRHAISAYKQPQLYTARYTHRPTQGHEAAGPQGTCRGVHAMGHKPKEPFGANALAMGRRAAGPQGHRATGQATRHRATG